MKVEVFVGGPYETNSYLVTNDAGEALLIDPTFDSKSFFFNRITQGHLNARAILLTHSHFDHIVDVAALKKRLNIPVYVHLLDQGNLIAPGTDGLPDHGVIGVVPDYLFQGDDRLSIGSFTVSILHTPGHSKGSSCFYFSDEKILFSGDTLFKGTYGNLSFPTSQPERMKQSLALLSQLPKETVVFPGHGEKTTIGKEDWIEHFTI